MKTVQTVKKIMSVLVLSLILSTGLIAGNRDCGKIIDISTELVPRVIEDQFNRHLYSKEALRFKTYKLDEIINEFEVAMNVLDCKITPQYVKNIKTLRQLRDVYASSYNAKTYK